MPNDDAKDFLRRRREGDSDAERQLRWEKTAIKKLLSGLGVSPKAVPSRSVSEFSERLPDFPFVLHTRRVKGTHRLAYDLFKRWRSTYLYKAIAECFESEFTSYALIFPWIKVGPMVAHTALPELFGDRVERLSIIRKAPSQERPIVIEPLKEFCAYTVGKGWMQ